MGVCVCVCVVHLKISEGMRANDLGEREREIIAAE